MIIRRIFAVSIMVLLLSASTLAAACDLSCTFAAMSWDCHSEQTEDQYSAPGGASMDGMSVAGMTMPEMGYGEVQQAVSGNSRTKASHASIGEMGPCERQACDNNSAVAVKTSRSVAPQLHSILVATETSRGVVAPPYFHDARDDIAHYLPLDGSPLQLSLRV